MITSNLKLGVTLLTLPFLLTFCVVAPPLVVYTLVSPYNSADVAWAKEGGNATVSGSSLLRLRNGDVQTCGGLPVRLFPFTDYAAERVTYIYGWSPGNETTMTRDVNALYSFDPDYPSYLTDAITGICNAQGEFVFNNVAPGEYFLVSQVAWQSAYVEPLFGTTQFRNNGTNLARHLIVGDGEELNVVLSQM